MNDSHAYHRIPGVSSHTLIAMTRSPLHCWAKYVDPDRQAAEPTPAQRFGTLVHTLVLTPDTFKEAFVVADARKRRTPEGKARYAAWRAADQQVITAQEYQAACQIVTAIQQHDEARALLANGQPEKIMAQYGFQGVDKTPAH